MADSGTGLNLLTAFWTNTALSVLFLLCYAILKNQPLNLRVYFPRLYVRGEEDHLNEYVACTSVEGRLARYVNLNWRSYLHSFNWVVASLKKTEDQLIEDVGLDSTVLVRIFLLGYGCLFIFQYYLHGNLVEHFLPVLCTKILNLRRVSFSTFIGILMLVVGVVQVEGFRPHVVVGMCGVDSCQ